MSSRTFFILVLIFSALFLIYTSAEPDLMCYDDLVQHLYEDCVEDKYFMSIKTCIFVFNEMLNRADDDLRKEVLANIQMYMIKTLSRS